MKNIKYVICSAVTLIIISGCDKTPTVETMLADPELRDQTFEVCLKNNVTAFNKSNQFYELCQVWRRADSICSLGNNDCKRKVPAKGFKG